VSSGDLENRLMAECVDCCLFKLQYETILILFLNFLKVIHPMSHVNVWFIYQRLVTDCDKSISNNELVLYFGSIDQIIKVSNKWYIICTHYVTKFIQLTVLPLTAKSIPLAFLAESYSELRINVNYFCLVSCLKVHLLTQHSVSCFILYHTKYTQLMCGLPLLLIDDFPL